MVVSGQPAGAREVGASVAQRLHEVDVVDRLIDRRSLPSEKWGRYAGRDVIPMWVADMDFAAPPPVLEALTARIAHGVFGYADPWPSLVEAVQAGIARDHGWHIEPDWLVWLPGVVTGFNVAVRAVGGVAEERCTPVFM